jgi:hypothetical protein
MCSRCATSSSTRSTTRCATPSRSCARRAGWGRYLPALRPQRLSVFDQLQEDERPCFGPELPLLKQRFRETTAGVVADAQAAGVPIILCTMVRNLRESPPSYSSFSDATRADRARRARWDAAYVTGLEALKAKDADGALAALDAARAIDEVPAKLYYAYGQAYRAGRTRGGGARGLRPGARARPSPMRAQAWAEQAIRDVAQRDRRAAGRPADRLRQREQARRGRLRAHLRQLPSQPAGPRAHREPPARRDRDSSCTCPSTAAWTSRPPRAASGWGSTTTGASSPGRPRA